MGFTVRSFTVAALSPSSASVLRFLIHVTPAHREYRAFSKSAAVLNIKVIHKLVSERKTAVVKLRKLSWEISRVTQVEKFNNPTLSFYKLQTIAHTLAIVPPVDITSLSQTTDIDLPVTHHILMLTPVSSFSSELYSPITLQFIFFFFCS